MNVEIEGNVWLFEPKEINKSLNRANKEAMRELAHRVIQDTTRYVPMSKGKKDSGTLRLSASVIKATRDEIAIGWSRPNIPEMPNGDEAASLLWYGLNPETGREVKNWTTPGTGGHWTEVAYRNHGDDWKKLFTYSWMETFR